MAKLPKLFEELKLLGGVVTPFVASTRGSNGSKVKKGFAWVDDGAKVGIDDDVTSVED